MYDKPWKKIFNDNKILEHNFEKEPFIISVAQIKLSVQDFKKVMEKRVRILCQQNTRENRPNIFKENNLFLLPIKNDFYAIVKGKGYVDIPKITTIEKLYKSRLNFTLDTLKDTSSEVQQIDFAYASSLTRTFMEDESLVLSIRGEKLSSDFDFYIAQQKISVQNIRTKSDVVYEGRNQVVCLQIKNPNINNLNIWQLFYPIQQLKNYTNKSISSLLLEKNGEFYSIWHFRFKDLRNFKSIELVKSEKFRVDENLSKIKWSLHQENA